MARTLELVGDTPPTFRWDQLSERYDFLVPDYQREYVWEVEDQVEQFLADGGGTPKTYAEIAEELGQKVDSVMKAVKRFDPERGVRLASFAIHWIKAEIHEYILRNWRLVKIATTKAQRKLFFNLRSMKKSSTALTPTEIKQVASTLNV